MLAAPYSIGVLVALLVLVGCIVGLVLLLAGVAMSVEALLVAFVIGACLAIARLT